MYDDITRTWLRWVRSPRGGRTLRRWADDEPALAGWAAEDLASPRCGDRADAMQAALVRLAQAGDQAATSTLIVQLRPGLTRVAWRAWHRRSAGPHPFASMADTRDEVLSAFGETLACHRLDRRPCRIAANLVLDTHQRLWRAAGRDDRAAAAAAAGRAVRSRPGWSGGGSGSGAGAGGPGVGPGIGIEPALVAGAAGSPDEVAGTLDLTAAVAAAIRRLPGSQASRQLSAELAFRAWILDEPSALIARELGLGRKTVDTRLCRLRALVRASQAERTADATRALRAARAAALRAGTGTGDSAPAAGHPAGGQVVARRSEGSAPASRPVAPSCARRQ